MLGVSDIFLLVFQALCHPESARKLPEGDFRVRQGDTAIEATNRKRKEIN
jgi:hypothetical protein